MYDVLFTFHLMIIEFMYLFWGQKINILFLFKDTTWNIIVALVEVEALFPNADLVIIETLNWISYIVCHQVVLAKESGLCYAALALVTDYDSWRYDDAAQHVCIITIPTGMAWFQLRAWYVLHCYCNTSGVTDMLQTLGWGSYQKNWR